MNPKPVKLPDLILEVDSVIEFTDVAIQDPDELKRISASVKNKKRPNVARQDEESESNDN